MKITSGRVVYARTFRTADYESIRVEAEIAYDLDPDDDPAVAQAEAFEVAKAEVRAQTMPVLAFRHKKLQALAEPALAHFVERLPGDVAKAFQELMDRLYQDVPEAWRDNGN